MSIPSVTQTERDGALGVLPDGDSMIAFMGVSDSGSIALPAAYARNQDISSTFGGGPLPQAASRAINAEQAVIMVRTGQSQAATETTIDVTGVTGASVATYGADTTANDDYELVFKVIAGGTVGVTGITYQLSIDGGRSFGPTTALGTATSVVFTRPDGSTCGGVGFQFTAASLNAGDIVRGTTLAPRWNTTEIGTAIAALINSTLPWDVLMVVGDLDGAAYDAIVTAMAAAPEKTWIGHFRKPLVTPSAESEAAYKVAFDAAFASRASSYSHVCAGAAQVVSPLDKVQYRRPVLFAIADLVGDVSPEVDIAQVDLGPLVGVNIRDLNGNPLEHDETVNPGLDDSRALVLRTWKGRQGVYVNNPRTLSAAGSDFQFLQHRRVFNIFKKTRREYFETRLSKPILVNTQTGFMLETEARTMELECDALIRSAIMQIPMASGGGFQRGEFTRVSRTDNLLSTNTVHVQGKIVPLAYPKAILDDVAFSNPALKTIGL